MTRFYLSLLIYCLIWTQSAGLNHAVAHHASLQMQWMHVDHDHSHQDEDKDLCNLCDMAAQGGHILLTASSLLNNHTRGSAPITRSDSDFHLSHALPSPAPRGPPVAI